MSFVYDITDSREQKQSTRKNGAVRGYGQRFEPRAALAVSSSVGGQRVNAPLADGGNRETRRRERHLLNLSKPVKWTTHGESLNARTPGVVVVVVKVEERRCCEPNFRTTEAGTIEGSTCTHVHL